MQKKMVMEKSRNKNTLDIQKTNCKLEDVNLNLSVIVLHVNGLELQPSVLSFWPKDFFLVFLAAHIC